MLVADRLIQTLLMMVSVGLWPPMTSGAFWIVAGIYAAVSILFNDETKRGNPGLEYSTSGDDEVSHKQRRSLPVETNLK